MKRLMTASLLSIIALTSCGGEEDGDNIVPAPTCTSACEVHTDCLITDSCIESCEAEEEASRDALIICLTQASPDNCDDVFACLPEDPPEGACYYICDDLINSCTAGTGVTEEACTEAADQDCGGEPVNLAFLPDCDCDGEGDCAAPEFSGTE